METISAREAAVAKAPIAHIMKLYTNVTGPPLINAVLFALCVVSTMGPSFRYWDGNFLYKKTASQVHIMVVVNPSMEIKPKFL